MGVSDRTKQSSSEPYEGVPRFTITVVGASGSGKTTYMHSLVTLLKDSTGSEFSLGYGANPQEQISTQENLRSWGWESVNNGVIDLPSPDVSVSHSEFTLYHRSNPVCVFDWVDYRGGAATLPAYCDTEEGELLQELIRRSDGLLLFVDAVELFYNNVYHDASIRSGVGNLNDILTAIAYEANNSSEIRTDKSIAVVLSKSDSDLIDSKMVARSTNSANGSNLRYDGILGRYAEVASTLNNTLWAADVRNSSRNKAQQLNLDVAITPVGSLGRENFDAGHFETKLVTPDGKTEKDCYREVEEYEIPRGNKLGKIFSPQYPPTSVIEFKKSGVSPKPENAFAPLLHVVSSLMNGNASSPLTEKTKRLLKQLLRRADANEVALRQGFSSAIAQNVIVPLSELPSLEHEDSD